MAYGQAKTRLTYAISTLSRSSLCPAPRSYLLQIAHMIQQLVEAGSLLRNLAAEFGRTPMQLFGSLKNLARRMLDAFRYMVLNDQAFDPLHAASIQIRLDSS